MQNFKFEFDTALLTKHLGVDKMIVVVMEPRMGYQALHRLTDHRDHVYALQAIGSYAISGGGDGLLLMHDVQSGQLLYGQPHLHQQHHQWALQWRATPATFGTIAATAF